MTVLFCDLVDFTHAAERLDPEDVRAIQAPYYGRVRAELERHGGTVEKFIGDAVMALFGAPIAHEDDPERAVRAALAIRDWVTEHGELRVRIAITTGEALVHLEAEPLSGEGMASGDVVNTAARLQAAAPENGVLVDETTYRATKDVVEYREAKPVTAKGKAEPVAVWEAVRALAPIRPDAGAACPLRGTRTRAGCPEGHIRERARRQLDTARDARRGARDREESTCPRVLQCRSSATARPSPGWQGRSLPYGAGVTLWALGEIVKSSGTASSRATETRKLTRSFAAPFRRHARGDARTPSGCTLICGRSSCPRATASPAATGAPRRSLPGGASSRRWPRSVPSSSSWRTCTGPTTRCSTLSSTSSSGRRESPLLVLATARPELLDRRPAWSCVEAERARR